MHADLAPAIARRLREAPGCLRAEFGYSTVTELTELYRALAATCIQKQARRVLIIAGDDEPAGERALRSALTMMVLAGIPADFRLALVIALPRAARVYRNTGRDLNAAGIKTRLFDSEGEALQWLDGRVNGAHRAV